MWSFELNFQGFSLNWNCDKKNRRGFFFSKERCSFDDIVNIWCCCFYFLTFHTISLSLSRFHSRIGLVAQGARCVFYFLWKHCHSSSSPLPFFFPALYKYNYTLNIIYFYLSLQVLIERCDVREYYNLKLRLCLFIWIGYEMQVSVTPCVAQKMSSMLEL